MVKRKVYSLTLSIAVDARSEDEAYSKLEKSLSDISEGMKDQSRWSCKVMRRTDKNSWLYDAFNIDKKGA